MLPMMLAAMLTAWAAAAIAQTGRSATAAPNLSGVYQAIPAGRVLPGGLKNSGSPADIALQPAAAQQMKSINLKDDPARVCKPVGPFRMMARDRNKIELIPSRRMIVMLFEDLSHGHMRIIFLDRKHPDPVTPAWHGDSVGRWEGDTLVVDTAGFNDMTWLNDSGAQPSDALHLVEHIRPVAGGKFLEYKMTGEDSKVLAKPYTYVRYYEKVNVEIGQD
jgi:hypothetical protein